MTQYKFIKPYSATISVGGAVGIRREDFKIGDKVDGTYSPKSGGIIIPASGIPGSSPTEIPNGYLEEISLFKMGFASNENTAFKYMIMGLVGIGILFGILKWQKVI
jgi:hypothetical protein